MIVCRQPLPPFLPLSFFSLPPPITASAMAGPGKKAAAAELPLLALMFAGWYVASFFTDTFNKEVSPAVALLGPSFAAPCFRAHGFYCVHGAALRAQRMQQCAQNSAVYARAV